MPHRLEMVSDFYPRSPRGERPHRQPARQAFRPHFYPRSPRGERHSDSPPMLPGSHFYPRSPRGERPNFCLTSTGSASFLSTLPARGATFLFRTLFGHKAISIHAPREGSDRVDHSYQQGLRHFYPRSPRGERLDRHRPRPGLVKDFYPRSPRGERPPLLSWVPVQFPISIHAPREGSDAAACNYSRNKSDFYPRSPRGERPRRRAITPGISPISIHAPREGSDLLRV